MLPSAIPTNHNLGFIRIYPHASIFHIILPLITLPWELLYADDLVVIAETEEDLIKRLNEWHLISITIGLQHIRNAKFSKKAKL